MFQYPLYLNQSLDNWEVSGALDICPIS